MEREKEAFIEWLYTQYAVKLERASLNWVQHRPEYRDMVDDSIQKTFLKACDGDQHLSQTAEAARGAGWRDGRFG